MTQDEFKNLKVGDKVKILFSNIDNGTIVEIRHKLKSTCIVGIASVSSEYHYGWLELVKPSALINWLSNPRL